MVTVVFILLFVSYSSGTLVNRGQQLLWSFWELWKRLKAVLQRSQFLCWSSTGKWMWYVILKAAECCTRMQAAQTKHCMYTQKCGISWLANLLRGLRKCLGTCLSGWMHVFHLKVMQSLDEVLESKLVQHISNIANHHLVPPWSKSIHQVHERSVYCSYLHSYAVHIIMVMSSTRCSSRWIHSLQSAHVTWNISGLWRLEATPLGFFCQCMLSSSGTGHHEILIPKFCKSESLTLCLHGQLCIKRQGCLPEILANCGLSVTVWHTGAILKVKLTYSMHSNGNV